MKTLSALCYEYHLSCIPDVRGAYRCGPVDYHNGRFGWYVLGQSPEHAVAFAILRMEEMQEERRAA